MAPLHVAVAAEDVGAAARGADRAVVHREDAVGAHVGRTDRVLRAAHAPDHAERAVVPQRLRDSAKLRTRHAGDALDFRRVVLGHFLLNVFPAVDAPADELVVGPAVLDRVPEDAPDQRNVGARAQAHMLGRVRGRAREARIADDERRLVLLLAAQHVQHRDGMRLRRIAADQERRTRVLDVVVGIGLRAVAPRLGDAGNRRRVADARLVVDVVGAPERRELAIEIGPPRS